MQKKAPEQKRLICCHPFLVQTGLKISHLQICLLCMYMHTILKSLPCPCRVTVTVAAFVSLSQHYRHEACCVIVTIIDDQEVYVRSISAYQRSMSPSQTQKDCCALMSTIMSPEEIQFTGISVADVGVQSIQFVWSTHYNIW